MLGPMVEMFNASLTKFEINDPNEQMYSRSPLDLNHVKERFEMAAEYHDQFLVCATMPTECRGNNVLFSGEERSILSVVHQRQTIH